MNFGIVHSRCRRYHTDNQKKEHRAQNDVENNGQDQRQFSEPFDALRSLLLHVQHAIDLVQEVPEQGAMRNVLLTEVVEQILQRQRFVAESIVDERIARLHVARVVRSRAFTIDGEREVFHGVEVLLADQCS